MCETRNCFLSTKCTCHFSTNIMPPFTCTQNVFSITSVLLKCLRFFKVVLQVSLSWFVFIYNFLSSDPILRPTI